ncbi:MAG: protein-disulfide isomerase [Thermoleophilia bacterium]|nr:protein-disulfide isomerase [Thermoleophilia bacterium]
MTTSLFAPQGTAAPHLSVPVDEHDHALGDSDAALTLVFYGDYQCPYCRTANATERALREQFDPSELRIVFRHYPITQKHPFALPAAIVAEAAGMQGRFWDMHDTLFANQDRLDEESLVTFARQAALDLDRFRRDVTEPYCEQKVERDFRSGVESGVEGTPAFFVNGIRYEGDYSADVMSAKLRAMLEQG